MQIKLEFLLTIVAERFLLGVAVNSCPSRFCVCHGTAHGGFVDGVPAIPAVDLFC